MTSGTTTSGTATTLLSALALLGAATVLAPSSALAGYKVHYLLSDQAGADHLDRKLRNAWGMAFQPKNFLWINQNRSGASGIYAGDGSPAGVAVVVPRPPAPRRPDIDPKFSAPTGIVANTANNFFVSNDPAWPAKFIFATEDGTIAAWFEGEGTDATLEIDNSLNGANCKPKPKVNCQGAVYKGLALGNSKTHGALLYATNFRSGKVEVYDSSYAPVNLGAAAFADNRIPAGYAPYNIVNIGGQLYVTYAQQDAAKHDSVSCARCGFVDIFSVDGALLTRLIPKSGNQKLNAPYGIAVAGSAFWPGGAVLIGNFGDGKINAYSPAGAWLGVLSDAAKKPIVLQGLWAILFPGAKGFGDSDPSKLYFTSGPNGEADGRFGTLAVAP